MQKSLEKLFSACHTKDYLGNNSKGVALRVRLIIAVASLSSCVLMAYAKVTQENHSWCERPLFVILFSKFPAPEALFWIFPHKSVIHVDHRSRKRNLAGEGPGKTRLQSWRGGARQRIQKRTCRGVLVCGEGPRHHQQNSYDSSNPSNSIILVCSIGTKTDYIFG